MPSYEHVAQAHSPEEGAAEPVDIKLPLEPALGRAEAANEVAHEAAQEKPKEKPLSEQIADQEALIADYSKFTLLCVQAMEAAKRLRSQAAGGVDLSLEEVGLSPVEKAAAAIMVQEMRKLPQMGFDTMDERLLLVNVERLFQKGPEALETLRSDIAGRHYQAALSLEGLERQRAAHPTGDDLLQMFDTQK